MSRKDRVRVGGGLPGALADLPGWGPVKLSGPVPGGFG